jgi:hypothetical protein
MKRRLYFLFPDAEQAHRAVADLDSLGVDRAHMHALARPDVDLGDLPPATTRQQRDFLMRIERGLWDGNLLLFALAGIGLIVAAVLGNTLGVVAAAIVMLASFLGGAWFAMSVPDVHLEEFRSALQHGEILLLVDVSRDCVQDVEELMVRRHPEAVPGGSGWTPDRFGV